MKVAQHIVDARRARLAELLQAEGYLPVAAVCERLAISEATARRDLAELERTQTITRTRGGALIEYNQRFPSFRERQAKASEAKTRIGAVAAALVEPGQTLWLDGGTTTHAIAQALANAGTSGLTVVTNNLPIADVLADRAGVSVHLLGGEYLRRSSLLLGAHTLDGLRAWSFDLAFLGAEGMDREGLSNSQADLVALQRAVAAIATRTVYAVDATKLGARAVEALAPWDAVDRLVSDASSAAFAAAGCALGDRLISA
ncbi:MAG: DeoR/GlpR transcriptional regulator [Planctomycetes bacterium]|nr:DeoR/GlpR transcriptional regulator [Planctomycetota bacterium]